MWLGWGSALLGGVDGLGGSVALADVGREGINGAGEGAESGEGEDDAGLLAEVLGVAGAVPEGLQFLNLVIELVGGDLPGETGFLLLLQLGFQRESLSEPGVDAVDNLADAGL